MRAIIILLINVFLISYSFSQSHSYQWNYADIQAGIDQTDGYLEKPENTISNKKRISKKQLKLTLGFDQIFSGINFNYGIDISIKNMAGEELPDAFQKIILNPDQVSGVWIYDLSSISNIDQCIVEVGALANTNDAEVQIFLQNHIRLKVDYELEYQYDVRDDTDILLNISTNNLELNGAEKVMGRNQVFTWSKNANHFFPGYQIQILRLKNYSAANSNEENIVSIVDWDKAFSFHLESSDLQVPLTVAEGTGFYQWRVRPIGNYYKGGMSNPKNYGQWTSAATQGAVYSCNLGTTAQSSCFFLVDEDEDKNWIYSRIMVEGGKTSEQISYADGLNTVRQTQNKLSSQDVKIVSQSIPDYSGRPALSTVPVPSNGNNLDGYKSNYVTTGGELYSAKHFDTDANFENPETVDDGVGKDQSYYSHENNTGKISTMDGYQFSRPQFKNDGTGRVVEESSPGYTHSLVGGKTVKTFYDTPSEEELVRIFGKEAPNPDKVQKVIKTDPNGVSSVSYIGDNGKVIATCLAGGDPDGNSTIQTINHTLTQNTVTDLGLLSQKSLSFTEPQTITITYKLPCEALELACTKVEFECDFGVVLKLYNQKEATTTEHPFPVALADATCTGGYKILTQEIEITTPGTYTISKYLVNLSDNVSVVQTALAGMKAKIQPVVNMVKSWMLSTSSYEEYDQLIANIEGENNFNTVKNSDLTNNGGSYPLDFSTLANPENLALTNEPFNLPLDFVLEAEHRINIIYEPDDNGEDKPSLIEIWGGCCGPIYVPIRVEKTAEDFCPSSLQEIGITFRQAVNDGLDFEGYLIETIGDANANWSEYLPGYAKIVVDDPVYGDINVGHFNQMIYHMVTDQYAIMGETELKSQYTCEELATTWIAYVNNLFEIKTSTERSYNINDATTDQHNPPSEDPQDNLFDGLDLTGIDFLNWILEQILSARVRNEVNDVQFTAALPQMFLNEVGRKFAKPLIYEKDHTLGNVANFNTVPVNYRTGDALDGVPVNWEPLPQDLTPDEGGTMDISGNPYLLSYYDAQVYAVTDLVWEPDIDDCENTGWPLFDCNTVIQDSLTREKMRYKNTFNNIYAFKYFTYVDKSLMSCEMATCYSGPDENDLYPLMPEANMDVVNHPNLEHDDYVLCHDNEGCSNRWKELWDLEQLTNFYTCTKYANEYNPPSIVSAGNCNDFVSDYDAAHPEMSLEDRLVAQRIDSEEACDSTCENKRGWFLDILTQEFENRCYRIDDLCPGDEDVIRTADLEAMATQLVNYCKGYCPDAEKDHCFCRDFDACFVWDYVTEELVRNDQYFEIYKLSPNERFRRNIAATWMVDIDVKSMCEDEFGITEDWATVPIDLVEEHIVDPDDPANKFVEDPENPVNEEGDPQMILVGFGGEDTNKEQDPEPDACEEARKLPAKIIHTQAETHTITITNN